MRSAAHRTTRARIALAYLLGIAGLTSTAAGAAPRTAGSSAPHSRIQAPQNGVGFSITPVSDAASLLACLLGPGVQVSNVSLTAAPKTAALFTGGAGIVGFDAGILLSTGDVDSVTGPNDFEDTSLGNQFPGDENLDSLVSQTQGGGGTILTYDATVLEFDFECGSPQPINIQYVFASEEYDEFVATEYNDVFAIFLDGSEPQHNIAVVAGACAGAPGEPIAINNVNCGFEGLDPGAPNCPCYVSNASGALDTEMDGMTRLFQATASVSAGTHHMKIAIADTSDEIYDANVFIRCGSLACGVVQTHRATWGRIKARYR